jgi:hypothetical protein
LGVDTFVPLSGVTLGSIQLKVAEEVSRGVVGVFLISTLVLLLFGESLLLRGLLWHKLLAFFLSLLSCKLFSLLGCFLSLLLGFLLGMLVTYLRLSFWNFFWLI